MIGAIAATLVLAGPLNTLTAEEKKEGWQLLFDGTSTKGWHNYNAKGVKPGWQVKDGVLTVSDPGNAGDLMTDKEFTWFELKLDFNYEKGQNSGILFRVKEGAEACWHTGPEIQIYDAPASSGQEITGYLYQLYHSTVDSSKPAGEWNTMHISISPDKCETKVNGVKYYEFVIDSEDFWARVAKSKFAEFKEFAKSKTGAIAIQGDHGHVSFRNIKIRPMKVTAAAPILPPTR